MTFAGVAVTGSLIEEAGTTFRRMGEFATDELREWLRKTGHLDWAEASLVQRELCSQWKTQGLTFIPGTPSLWRWSTA